MDNTKRMQALVQVLREAAKAYYALDAEIMSNYEYDKLYDELVALEEATGIVLAGSPTVQVGYDAVEELPKERHAAPMLSLGKTKSREELQAWLNGKEGVLSWKLDGLTVVLTYEGGTLQKAVTRGNGEIGEVITQNARAFENLPLKIPFQGRLILRGEAVISYSDFEKMNAEIAQEEARYKNPRNLCSGSVRQLDSAVTARRHVQFHAFSLVEAGAAQPTAALAGEAAAAPAAAPTAAQLATAAPAAEAAAAQPAPQLAAVAQPAAQSAAAPAVAQQPAATESLDFHNSRLAEFAFLKAQGFAVVEHVCVNPANILEEIESFAEKIKTYDIPSDGLVLTFEDIAYGASLGRTAKFPRHSIAFKWADEIKETTLLEVEWSASRTGLINPVAIFAPVELEGTSVSRASLHNVSIVKSLKLGLGDTLTVYKANMIIPQVAENLTGSDTLKIPCTCPVCGGETAIRAQADAESLYCTNEKCPAKQIKAFAHFVSRDALNMDGLSEATLEKWIAAGFLHTFADLYHLDRFQAQITAMEGFGEKSYANALENIEKSRHTSLPRLLYALGIPGIGVANAKLICNHFGHDLAQILTADAEALSAIDGVGPILAGAMTAYFSDAENKALLNALTAELDIEKPAAKSAAELPLAGKTFVITGTLNTFANRKELADLIEAKGGKVAGSVSAKTTALINNDNTSASTKNKKAKALGIPILTEADFVVQLA